MGQRFVYTYPTKAALATVKAKARALTRRATDLSLSILLHRLNPVLRGWAAYFRHGVSKRTFRTPATIDTEASRMSALIDQLLALARMDEARTLDVGSLAGDIVEDADTEFPRNPTRRVTPPRLGDWPTRTWSATDRARDHPAAGQGGNPGHI